MIFPKPQKMTVTGAASLGADIGITAEREGSRLYNRLLCRQRVPDRHREYTD